MVRTQYYRTAFQASTGLCSHFSMTGQADAYGMACVRCCRTQRRGSLPYKLRYQDRKRYQEEIGACTWQPVCLSAGLHPSTWALACFGAQPLLQSMDAGNSCCAIDAESGDLSVSQSFLNAMPPGRPSLSASRDTGLLSIWPHLHPCHAPGSPNLRASISASGRTPAMPLLLLVWPTGAVLCSASQVSATQCQICTSSALFTPL